MAINLVLTGPPQTERSIVPAFQTNFNRIRDAFLHSAMQVSFVTGGASGPWPATVNVNVPYKSDILLYSNISFFSNAAAQIAMNLKWNGAAIALFDQFFNEVSSHKTIGTVGEARGVAAGSYPLSVDAATGGMLSDANDRWRYAAVFFEVV